MCEFHCLQDLEFKRSGACRLHATCWRLRSSARDLPTLLPDGHLDGAAFVFGVGLGAVSSK